MLLSHALSVAGSEACACILQRPIWNIFDNAEEARELCQLAGITKLEIVRGLVRAWQHDPTGIPLLPNRRRRRTWLL